MCCHLLSHWGHQGPSQHPLLDWKMKPFKPNDTNSMALVSMLSHSAVSDFFATPWTVAHRLLCPWDFPGKILEWVAISYSWESSQPRDQTHVSRVSCIDRWIPYHCALWEAVNVSSLPAASHYPVFPIQFLEKVKETQCSCLTYEKILCRQWWVSFQKKVTVCETKELKLESHSTFFLTLRQ